MITGHDIICLSWLAWDSIPLIMHQMMTRLAKGGNRVLFVDPPIAYSNLLLTPSMAKGHFRKTRLWLSGLKKAAENLHVLYPPPLAVQYGHSGWIDRANQAWTAASIRRSAGALRFQAPILWTYHPYAVRPHGQFGERLVCYDCNDDVAFFFSRHFNKRARLERMEEELTRNADVVLATSRYLLGLRKAQNPNTHYLPSALDCSIFSSTASPSCVVAEEVDRLRKPVIGFVGGMVNSKMNWRWITDAASARPEWSFCFVGPCAEPPPAEVAARPNIVFLGSRSQGELPAILKGFDVCLIPYQGEEFLRACQPTKTFEYLAAGKPVVSVWMPELEAYADIVFLARTSAEFLSGIDRALEAGKSPERVALYRQQGQGYTWEDRVERVSAILVEALEAKAASSGRRLR